MMKKNILRKGFHFLSSKFDTFALKRGKGEERKIYKIIKELEQGHWLDEEKEALKKISNLRVFYSKNSNQIFIKDYGFGSSNDSRTEQQMSQGIEKTEKVSEIYHSASSSNKHGEFMFKIIRSYKPRKCFELGTCLGVSAAYAIESLRLNKSNDAFTTFEGSPELANLSESTLRDFHFTNFRVVNGRFADVLPKYISENNNIDFGFIDGHHEEKETIKYFEMFYPKLSNNSILLFDDINWSKGMRNAWRTIKQDKRVTWTVDNYFRGICYIDKTNKEKGKNYKIWV